LHAITIRLPVIYCDSTIAIGHLHLTLQNWHNRS
jgi:hypothetical protein